MRMRIAAAMLVLVACSRRDPAPARLAAAKPCTVHDVELVYVVDRDGYLSSFDPRKLPADPFHVVGTLTCDRKSHPLSMAIDRSGIAWVLYTSGSVYQVSILDARCSRAVYTYDRSAPKTFGMGFVSDGPGSATERLYVAADGDPKTLGRLELSPRRPRFVAIGEIPLVRELATSREDNPELTGTGDGRLFAYFPEPDLGFVQELDRTTGKTIGRPLLTGDTGHVTSWAFAQWGGVFYLFTTADDNSAVHALDRDTGRYQLVRDHLASHIVGAGVSTCAPMLEQAP